MLAQKIETRLKSLTENAKIYFNKKILLRMKLCSQCNVQFFEPYCIFRFL